MIACKRTLARRSILRSEILKQPPLRQVNACSKLDRAEQRTERTHYGNIATPASVLSDGHEVNIIAVPWLVTAVLFWWTLVHGRYGRLAYGVSVLYVFTTALHSGALGALIPIADRVWYPSYSEEPPGSAESKISSWPDS